MYKRVVYFFVAITLLLIGMGIFASAKTTSPQKLVARYIQINDIKIPVEVANTKELQAKGLSDRESLDAGSGMLFDFGSTPVNAAFWMKDMHFSLDMIWIAGDKIVKIDPDIPYPAAGTPDSQLPLYTPQTLINYVLEVNAGFAASNNIKVGDQVQLLPQS